MVRGRWLIYGHVVTALGSVISHGADAVEGLRVYE